MTMDKINAALQVLQEAKRLEQEGQAFYHKAAEQTNNAKGKDIFRSLVRDEVMHERLIQREIDALTANGQWVELTEVKGPRRDLGELVFPQGREGLEKAVQANTTETEALITALEIETKSYDLYRREAEAASDPAARELYVFLAGQERTHFDLLMVNYESMVRYGGWAD